MVGMGPGGPVVLTKEIRPIVRVQVVLTLVAYELRSQTCLLQDLTHGRGVGKFVLLYRS